MTATEEREMHALAKQLAEATNSVGWEAGRYFVVGRLMERLAEYCAVCNCQRGAGKGKKA